MPATLREKSEEEHREDERAVQAVATLVKNAPAGDRASAMLSLEARIAAAEAGATALVSVQAQKLGVDEAALLEFLQGGESTTTTDAEAAAFALNESTITDALLTAYTSACDKMLTRFAASDRTFATYVLSLKAHGDADALVALFAEYLMR